VANRLGVERAASVAGASNVAASPPRGPRPRDDVKIGHTPPADSPNGIVVE